MSAEQIRSIGCGPIGALISAIIGSLIFNWQVRRWSHRIPSNFGQKEKNQLLKEYKNTNRIARVFALAGLYTMLLYYRKEHEMTGSDWRGIGIAIGLMAFLPVAYIIAANVMHGTEKVKEALVAFLIYERTPPKEMFIFIGICFITGLICAISVLLQPP
jgi:integral membrane sensor domain MASE1